MVLFLSWLRCNLDGVKYYSSNKRPTPHYTHDYDMTGKTLIKLSIIECSSIKHDNVTADVFLYFPGIRNSHSSYKPIGTLRLRSTCKYLEFRTQPPAGFDVCCMFNFLHMHLQFRCRSNCCPWNGQPSIIDDQCLHHIYRGYDDAAVPLKREIAF